MMEFSSEKWVDVKNYEGLYQISNLGRVRSLDKEVKNRYSTRIIKGKLLKPYEWGCGYLYVQLHNGSNRESISIHRLVALHFVPNPNEKPEVNHIDGNKHNNQFDNLEWVTSSENEKHAYDNGLFDIYNRIKVKCLNKDTLEETVYDSLLEAGMDFGISRNRIYYLFNKKYSQDNCLVFDNYILTKVV